jgi:hypothetical protein
MVAAIPVLCFGLALVRSNGRQAYRIMLRLGAGSEQRAAGLPLVARRVSHLWHLVHDAGSFHYGHTAGTVQIPSAPIELAFVLGGQTRYKL